MEITDLKLKVSSDLRNWIEARSIQNFRSMRAEVVAILSAVKDGEECGDGFERFANPSGVPGASALFPETNITRKGRPRNV